MKIRSFYITALYVSFVLLTKGQTTFTLDRCLDIAREKNLKLRFSDLELQSLNLLHDEISTTGLPQISLHAGASYAPSFDRFGYDPALTNGGELAGQIEVEQSIFDGGVRGLKLDQTKLDIQRATIERKTVNRDLTFECKRLFIEALRAQNEIKLEQESVGQLVQYLEIVERLSKGGNASYTDLLKTQVQLSNAKISLQKAAEAIATAKYSLSELLGIAVDTSFNVEGSLENLLGASIDTASNQLLIPPHTLDIDIAELAIQKNILDMELSKRERFPVVSL